MTMDLSPVTLVPVEWILKNVTSSIDLGEVCAGCGGSRWYCPCPGSVGIDVEWGWMLEDKGSDCTWDFIDSVMEEGIKAPICISVRPSASGDYLQFGNGHHRVTVAILAVFDYIPVVFAFDGDYMHEETTEHPSYDGCSMGGNYASIF